MAHGTMLQTALLRHFVVVFFISGVFYATYVDTQDVFEINTKNVAFTVDQRFLSLGLDSSMIAHDMKRVELKSKELYSLCSGLRGDSTERTEVILRIGGGLGDNITYKPEGLDLLLDDKTTLYVLNNTEWDEINAFVESLQWRLVFGLNLELRKEDGSWDPSNAIELIRYTQSRGYDVQFELGNEPDLYFEYRSVTVSALQLAADFQQLKEILQRETGGRSSLYGPDVATLTRFNLFPNYYGPSTTATADDFTNPEYQDKFINHVNQAISIIRSGNGTKNTPIWVGETASTYGGGAKGLSNAYVAGFLWMDKLGVAARMGVSLMFRWTLLHGHYAIVDRQEHDVYTPYPDYWLSLLYKQLVGERVLAVTDGLAKGRSLRTYAHCVYRYNGRGYDVTAVTVMAINDRKDSPAVFSFAHELSNLDVDAYILSPVDNDLSSPDVKLNGEVLKIVNGTVFPTMKPVRQSQPITLPPLTFGFFVIPNANAVACKFDGPV